jgi:transposase
MSTRPMNYPPELCERAIRMFGEVRPEYSSDWAACASVADKLGIGTPQTLLNWVRKAQVDAGQRPGMSAQAAELRRLRAENKQLRTANEIQNLTTTSLLENRELSLVLDTAIEPAVIAAVGSTFDADYAAASAQ